MPVLHFTCTNCGVGFARRSNHVRPGSRPFCSNACIGEFRGGSVTLRCDHCDTVFRRKRSLSRGQHSFCSYECMGANKRIGCINKQGYRVLTVDGADVLEHRFVVEQLIGRPLLPSEIVHHLDGDKLNNSLANLAVMDRSGHAFEHNPLLWDFQAAQAMLAEGRTLRQTCEALGVPKGTLSSALHRYGLTVTALRTGLDPTTSRKQE